MMVLGHEVPYLPEGIWYEFAFTLLLWALLAMALIFIVAPLLMRWARESPTTWDVRALQAIRKPIFSTLVFYGLSDSLHIITADDGISAGVAANMVVALDLIIVVCLTWLAYKLFKEVIIPLLREVARRTESKVDDLMVPLVEKLGLVVIVLFGLSGMLERVGINPGVALAGMGVAGLVIAFAAQDTLSNFFSGLHLMLDRPFEIGDTILLDEKERADVLDIGLRSCKMYDRRTNTLVIMPNNRIASSKITNLTKPDTYFRIKITVSVSYNSDPAKVRDLLREVANAHPKVLKENARHPIRSRFEDFGDSGLVFVLKCWIDDANQLNNYAAELRHLIWEAFEREGIEIPYPQRVLHWSGEGETTGVVPGHPPLSQDQGS